MVAARSGGGTPLGWCVAVSKKLSTSIPRLALTPREAAAAIGVGEDFFSEHVRPELQLIRRGRKVLVPVAELERWMRANAERPLRADLVASAPLAP